MDNEAPQDGIKCTGLYRGPEYNEAAPLFRDSLQRLIKR